VPPYTVVSLRQVEDSAVRFGHSPGLEARFARDPLQLQRSGLSYQRLAPGFRMPFGHRHREQEEIYVLLSGRARLAVGDDVVELGPLDAVRVSSEVTRCFEAGPHGAELLAFGAPGTGLGDAEMAPGWWSGEPPPS
jgi:hypothetical protein